MPWVWQEAGWHHHAPFPVSKTSSAVPVVGPCKEKWVQAQYEEVDTHLAELGQGLTPRMENQRTFQGPTTRAMIQSTSQSINAYWTWEDRHFVQECQTATCAPERQATRCLGCWMGW